MSLVDFGLLPVGTLILLGLAFGLGGESSDANALPLLVLAALIGLGYHIACSARGRTLGTILTGTEFIVAATGEKPPVRRVLLQFVVYSAFCLGASVAFAIIGVAAVMIFPLGAWITVSVDAGFALVVGAGAIGDLVASKRSPTHQAFVDRTSGEVLVLQGWRTTSQMPAREPE